MRIPFTVEQFLAVFERYNGAIGAAPLLAYALGALALALACQGRPRNGRIVLAVLALFWTFIGVAYHLAFFREVNPAATAFGILFVVQGGLFARAASRAEPLVFRLGASPRHALALAFAAYAMIGYPLLGAALGHSYPRAPVFGVAPCPTTIFTFALLLLAEGVVPVALWVIPLLWSIVGVSAAVQLGVREDFGLAIAGVAGAAILGWRRRARTAALPSP